MKNSTILIPKRTLGWLDVIIACCWTTILWPIWLKAMGLFMSIVIAVASATFITYCITELWYWLDKLAFNKWKEDNKDQIKKMEQQFEQIHKDIQAMLEKGKDNGPDQAVGTGDCEQTTETESIKEKE